jgi:hypothetical protein
MKKNDVKLWYERLPKDMIPKYDNPGYKNHGIGLPFRGLIVGGSGSGKTNLALELLHRFTNTFGKVYVFCLNEDEPLYKFLASKLEPYQLEIREGYEAIPPLDSLETDMQILCIFDDLCLAKDQSVIADYYIRSRKIGKGISCLYLSQSYFQTPKVVRLQCTFIFLKKLMSVRDLAFVIKDFSLVDNKEELFKIYDYCVGDGNPVNFLFVDLNAPEERRFRKCFSEIIDTAPLLKGI